MSINIGISESDRKEIALQLSHLLADSYTLYLKTQKVFDASQCDTIFKIIGFRNILVHDYLNVDEKIVQSIVKKQTYQQISTMIKMLKDILDNKP